MDEDNINWKKTLGNFWLKIFVALNEILGLALIILAHSGLERLLEAQLKEVNGIKEYAFKLIGAATLPLLASYMCICCMRFWSYSYLG